MIKLRGEVEIIGKENGKTIYYDKGPNTVTYWARHAVMHLLTGDIFTKGGQKRGLNHSFDNNPDGTLLSGSQYFHNNSNPDYDEDFYWSKASTETNNKKFPIMPVKMLFGTGHEFENYSDFINEGVELKDEWEDETIFNTNIDQGLNSTFSNIFDDNTSTTSFPKKTRTVNSRTSEPITNKEIKQDDLAVSGAIKNGNFNLKGDLNEYTVEDQSSGRILKKEYRGVGNPCFIYPLRGASTFNEESSQVMLTQEEVDGNTLETKLTFTVVMPEQTGINSDEFYPYNGYTIKEVGLFSDSHLFLENVPGNFDKRMPYGLMFAKRYITPFVKTSSSSFTIRWTIYI